MVGDWVAQWDEVTIKYFYCTQKYFYRPDLLRLVLLQRGDAAVHVGEAAGDGPHLLQAAGGRGQQQ